MGSKQSISDPTEWVFFQITFLSTKNHQKKSDGTNNLVIATSLEMLTNPPIKGVQTKQTSRQKTKKEKKIKLLQK